ncbi:MAG: membrane protein [Cryomorphaceae bacterium]|nr:MAG: membrane protein [Cryomorphaceae bacterium]
MNVALYIAKRYLFSTKRKNAVNIITAISILGIAVGTLALVVVLSVFNGFESLIKDMYHPVSADFVVTPVYSKDFSVASIDYDELQKVAVFSSIQEVYEEKVLLSYDNREQLAKIRGIKQSPCEDSLAIEKYIFKGESFRSDSSWAILGQSLAYTLSVSAGQFSKPLQVFVPKVNAKFNSISERPFVETSIYVSGIYSVQPVYDASYVITSLETVQDFLSRPSKLTQIEFNTSQLNKYSVQEALQASVGPDFKVKSRYQQNEFLYKVLQTEKWAIFFILSFILLIATFNIVASVIMIILEKRKDIFSLRSIGASDVTLTKIFFYEGLLVTFFGAVLGLFFGVGLCSLQQKFGLLTLGSEGDFIVNSYPVEVQTLDIFLIMLTVVSIGVVVTLIPVQILKRKFLN